jgi:hypothetical protein
MQTFRAHFNTELINMSPRGSPTPETQESKSSPIRITYLTDIGVRYKMHYPLNVLNHRTAMPSLLINRGKFSMKLH